MTDTAKPRVTAKRAMEWIAATTDGDGVEDADEEACVLLTAHLFGIDSPLVQAHVDALRAEAKSAATLEALTAATAKRKSGA